MLVFFPPISPLCPAQAPAMAEVRVHAAFTVIQDLQLFLREAARVVAATQVAQHIRSWAQ